MGGYYIHIYNMRMALFLFLARDHHLLSTLLEFHQNFTLVHSTNSVQEHSSYLTIYILPYQNGLGAQKDLEILFCKYEGLLSLKNKKKYIGIVLHGFVGPFNWNHIEVA